jgi:hypothetical protein
MTVLTSFTTLIPELFSGPNLAQIEVSHLSNFGGIKTPELWGCGDGKTRAENFIEQFIQDFLPHSSAQCEALFGMEFKSFTSSLR